MSFVAAALQHTAEFAETESLKRFRDSLDPRWISEALEATGTATLRRRRLPADQIIWLVLGMALQRDRPITEVVSKLDLALPGQGGSDVLAPSSVVHARHRLGAAPMKWLFEKCALSWAGAGQRWRGLALYGADGSTLRVADTDENREHFGLARGRAGASGYPLVRIVTLMRLRSRVLAAAAFGPYSKSELGLCEGLWSHVPDDSLTVVDRLFCSASVLLGLQSGGENRHWLLRARKNAKWTVLESFGRYDKLVELTVSRDARRKNPDLPKKFVARAVSYKHPRSKGRQWLLTSLKNATEHPAKELVALYHERWEIELGYDEIKTHLLDRQETIRSRTVEGVKQEIWGILLMYNLIRIEMVRIAAEAKVPPARISFVAAMRFIRDEWGWCAVAAPGSIPKKLRRMRERVVSFVLPPRRSERSYPRAVKLQSSGYTKKHPRRDAK